MILPKVTPGDPDAADAAGPTLADRNLTMVDGRLNGLVSRDTGRVRKQRARRSRRSVRQGHGRGVSDPDDEDSKGAACSLSV